MTAASHVGDALDNHLIVRDCCRLHPFDGRLSLLFRLLHVTLAASAIALVVTSLLAVEAVCLLVLLCLRLGVISLLLSLHE